jgi:hypothetical protein
VSAIPTIDDVAYALDGIGIPHCLQSWPDKLAPDLPYVLLVPTDSRNQKADNRTYARAREWDLEIYSRRLDMGLVVTVEDALDAAGIAYDSNSPYVDSRNHYALVRLKTTLQE